MAVAEGIKWEGAEALKGFLVPVDELTPWEQNPRKGDVMAIVGSLRRFGQVRAIATRADGKSVVAGHHLRLAAIELGWTHVAAIPHQFKDDAEAEIYGLADNELAMLGGYDEQKMFEVMEQHQLFDPANLEGTGFTLDRTEDIMAAAGQVPTATGEVIQRGYSENEAEAAERASHIAAGNAMKETVLMLTLEEREKFDENVRVLSKFYDLSSVIQIVLRALDDMAAQVRQIDEQAERVEGTGYVQEDAVSDATVPEALQGDPADVEPLSELQDPPGHDCELKTGLPDGVLDEGMTYLVQCSCGWFNQAIHGEMAEKMRQEHYEAVTIVEPD